MSTLRPIADVARDAGLAPEHVAHYGQHRAKVSLEALDAPGPKTAQHVLVSAMTPTTSGEGKTVTTIGLAMGLTRRGHTTIATLRQSSLGPTFGGKGGGAGGGAATLTPIDECILGLADDLFAVEAANNLLAAIVDDHIHRNREPFIAADAITWRRVLDVDDRALRSIVSGLGGPNGGVTRETGFDITPASEVMAILTLSRDRADLRRRLGAIVVGFDRAGAPVTAEQLQAPGAMAALLQRALAPNLVQTVEGTPVLVHTGPFANIAPGNSSVIADRVASTRADFVVTEAGFATELGAEKYFDLKVPVSGLAPSVAVLVVTARAVRAHDGAGGSLDPGLANVRAHIANLRSFGAPVVAAINRFPDDTAADLAAIRADALAAGASAVAELDAFARGGAGALELADAVVATCRGPVAVNRPYAPEAPVEEKVERLATTLYGAGRVEWEPAALRALERFRAAGFANLPVCVAKTNASLSHDPTLLGAPTGYTFPVRALRLAAGAGYITVLTGEIMTMPGLPGRARFAEIDVDPDGTIRGLV